MSRVINMPGTNFKLPDMVDELRAACDVVNLNFSDRGAPLSNAKNGRDLFARAGMMPLALHRREGLNCLIAYLRTELDKGELDLESLDLSLLQEPYYLRQRFSALLSAINARADAEMAGINLTVELTPNAALDIQSAVSRQSVTADTFQIAATSAYLNLIRTRNFTQADALASTFLPDADSGAAVFDVARVPERVISEAYEEAKYRALGAIDHESGRDQALADLQELASRNRVSDSEVRAAVRDQVVDRAQFDGEIPACFKPFIDRALAADDLQARKTHAAQGLEMLSGDYPVMTGGSRDPAVLRKAIDEKIDRLRTGAERGLTNHAAIDKAICAGYLKQLSVGGRSSGLTLAFAAQEAARAVSEAEIVDSLKLYAVRLSERRPSQDWVADVAEHEAYFADGIEDLLLAAAYGATTGMHPQPALLEAITERFPALELRKIGSKLPPVNVYGVELRGALDRQLVSPDAKALARVFCDWWGDSLTSFLSKTDPLSPSHKIGQLRDACALALDLPVAPPNQLLAAINAMMCKDGTTTEEAETARAVRDRESKTRLAEHVRAALGHELTEIPYAALVELRSELLRINDRMKKMNEGS